MELWYKLLINGKSRCIHDFYYDTIRIFCIESCPVQPHFVTCSVFAHLCERHTEECEEFDAYRLRSQWEIVSIKMRFQMNLAFSFY
jgi:hypothetical protein